MPFNIIMLHVEINITTTVSLQFVEVATKST